MKVYLDDERTTPEGWHRTYTVEETLAVLRTGEVTHLSLDNDLGDGNLEGRYVADNIEHWVKADGFVPPEIQVHSMNSVAAMRMRVVLANIERYHAENEERRSTLGREDADDGGEAV